MIKHSVSRNRSENHIVITISVGEREDVEEIKKAIQKTLRRFKRLLNGKLSYEYQMILSNGESHACTSNHSNQEIVLNIAEGVKEAVPSAIRGTVVKVPE